MSKKIPGGKGSLGRRFTSGGRAGRTPGSGLFSFNLGFGFIEHEKEKEKPNLARNDRKSPGRQRGNGKGGGK
jgi:hypothetical protein